LIREREGRRESFGSGEQCFCKCYNFTSRSRSRAKEGLGISSCGSFFISVILDHPFMEAALLCLLRAAAMQAYNINSPAKKKVEVYV
jgi:hypothetical protein